MADVGIRELRARLSEYLDRAERGEVVTVTERGRPKAVLGPVPGRARIEEGVAAGWITSSVGGTLGPARPHPGRMRVTDALAEDRGG